MPFMGHTQFVYAKNVEYMTNVISFGQFISPLRLNSSFYSLKKYCSVLHRDKIIVKFCRLMPISWSTKEMPESELRAGENQFEYSGSEMRRKKTT